MKKLLFRLPVLRFFYEKPKKEMRVWDWLVLSLKALFEFALLWWLSLLLYLIIFYFGIASFASNASSATLKALYPFVWLLSICIAIGIGTIISACRDNADSSEGEVSKPGKRKVSTVVWLLLIGSVVVMLARCGNISIDWQEEVRMADGEMLLVDRTAKGEMSGELGGPKGWAITEMSVEVLKLPANRALPPVWRISKKYVPLLLDYEPKEHTWNVVATFVHCYDWARLGRPALPYVEYQSKNGGPWQVVPLEQRLIGHKANLLLSPSYKGEPLRELTKWLQYVIPNYEETPNTVTAEEKDWRNRSASKNSRSILAVWEEGRCN